MRAAVFYRFVLPGVLAAAGLAAGALSVGGGPDADGGPAASAWAEPEASTDYSRSEARFRVELMRSGLFGRRLLMIAESGQTAPAQAPPDAGPFPRVLSAAVLDGKPTAILSLPEGETLSVRAGDETPNGWTVVKVGLDGVEAEQNGQTSLFPLFEGSSEAVAATPGPTDPQTPTSMPSRSARPVQPPR